MAHYQLTMNPLSPPTVWILFGEIAYEGQVMLAVLPSKEEAEELKLWGEQHKIELGLSSRYLRYGYDRLLIEKWTVGQRHPTVPVLPTPEPPSFSYWPHRPF